VQLTGVLDFENSALKVPLLLDDVVIEETVILSQAEGKSLGITRSVHAGVMALRLRLEHSLELVGSSGGPVMLRGSHIGGDLDCAMATFRKGEYGAAFIGDEIHVEGTINLNGMHAEGVQLANATIGGVLDCSGAELIQPQGAALVADGARVGGSVFLRDGFRALGEVRLISATIGGNFECISAEFTCESGSAALVANGAKVAGSMYLSRGFIAQGEVRLIGAMIDGVLNCGGGRFHNPGGDALTADNLRVTASMFLRNGFHAEGVVRLPNATIGSTLDCYQGTFHNTYGYSLAGQGLTIAGGLVWRGVFDVTGALSLVSAHVGDLVDDPQSWRFEFMTFRLQGLRVDRFVDEGVEWTWQERRAWLDAADYSGPGPYEMVLRWYRSIGRDRDARKIAIAKEDARTATLRSWRRWPRVAWRLLSSYGYERERSVVGLLTVLYLWGVVEFGFFTEMVLARPSEVYRFNEWVYSFDILFPVIDLRQATQWAPAGTSGLVTMWVLIIAGWALSLALVAIISGLYAKKE
jgi:hypothetical protein